MIYKKIIFAAILFWSASLSSGAQSIIKYEVITIDSISPGFVKDFFETSLDGKDSLSYYSLVQQDISALWALGYLTSSLDTIFVEEKRMIARVYIGEQYTFGDVEVTVAQHGIVSAAGLKNVRWKDKMISQSMIKDYTESLLTYLENNGYPFAKVRLDSTSIESGKLNGKLKLDRKKFVPFDSLSINGNIEIRQSFLDRYLNIRAKDPYSRKKINNITRRINDLTYLELDSTPIIKFANDYAQVQLYLKRKKASRFDFLIGVLPTTVAGETKFNITGEFTTEMYNRLGQGEYIYANFQRIDPTQQIELRIKYPYLFNLPIGVDVKGGIYFNEEFRETIFEGGILYQFDGNATFKASWNNKSSRLIVLDTASIIASKMLPGKLDLTYNGGGVEFAASDLDYRFNPSKGWDVRLGGTVGIKKIIRNNAIEALSTETTDFGAAYDALKLSTFQTEVKLSTALYIPAFKVATLKLGIEGGLQYNEERLYDNELHRIGGNKLLRGFDEQSILTDKFLVSTIEFRLLLDRNSYLSFPFIDYGITHVKDGEDKIWDSAISFGLGINFATPAGIFNVSFAAGKRLGNPLDFGNTKLHFGYVSLF